MSSPVDIQRQPQRVQLTLGPLFFNWDGLAFADFYARIADEAPFDRVHVGEVVCSKREPFCEVAQAKAIERLEQAGKTVVVSTLALVTTKRERQRLASVARSQERLVEANDLSALAALAGRPHVVGPLMNTYNEATLAFLAGNGATAVCLPPELPLASIRRMASAGTALGVGIEIFAFGRMPLAISARCYHARIQGLTRDSCRYVCNQDGDGLDVETLDGQPFLAINGLQTLSHAWCSYAGDVARLVEAGIGALRLSPQTCDMVAAAQVFRDVLDGRLDPGGAEQRLGRLAPHASFASGYLDALPGIAARSVGSQKL